MFFASEQFSINLQAKDITIQEAITGAKLLSTHLRSLRYRHAYFEMLELTVGEVERRFDQADLLTINDLECCEWKGRPPFRSSPELFIRFKV